MNDVIELENRIDEQGMRVVHLMADRPLTATDLIGYWPPEGARVETAREAGVHHLRAEWPYVHIIEVRPGQQYVLRDIRKGERISEAVGAAVRDYLREFGHGPQYAYLRRLPRNVPIGYAIRYLGWEIFLLQADDWLPEGQVAVGEPGTQIGDVSDQLEAEIISAPMQA